MACKAIIELRQNLQQLGPQLANLFGIHAILLGKGHRFADFPKLHKINLAL
jgi:hypothetical protein